MNGLVECAPSRRSLSVKLEINWDHCQARGSRGITTAGTQRRASSEEERGLAQDYFCQKVDEQKERSGVRIGVEG
jgi:hypothetical protein